MRGPAFRTWVWVESDTKNFMVNGIIDANSRVVDSCCLSCSRSIHAIAIAIGKLIRMLVIGSGIFHGILW